MFNINVINTLSKFINVSNTAIISYPTTYINSDHGVVALKLEINKLDEDPFEDFGLFQKLNKFVQIFSIFNNPTIKLENGIFTIKDKKSEAQFITDNKELLESYTFNAEIFEKIKNTNNIANFDLTVGDIKSLKQAKSIYDDLDKLQFKGLDSDLTISLSNKSKFSNITNSYTINKENAECQKNFDISINLETLLNAPILNYHVEIKYNEVKDIYAIFLTSEDLPCFEMVFSTLS